MVSDSRWTLIAAVVAAAIIGGETQNVVGSNSSSAVEPGIQAPNCDITPTVRYSPSCGRLYLEGGGCITLADIVDMRTDGDVPNGPLYYFNRVNNTISTQPTDTFFLNSSLYVQDNVLLQIVGPEYGGTARHLFMKSDKDTVINLRAYGGQILIQGCKVRSFDRSRNNGRGGIDEDPSDGRSYISAVSEVVVGLRTCTDQNMGEAKLDIIDSKIMQLGYNDSESYGVSYMVRGLCEDESNLDIMNTVSVWGEITDSVLAYNFQGAYFYGHQTGLVQNNHVHHNYDHGLNLDSDSKNMVIRSNNVHRNGVHGILCSKRCNRVTIDGNEVHRNGKTGVMLYGPNNEGSISGNYIHRNDDGGIDLFESSQNSVTENTVRMNNYGIRWSVGASYNTVHSNTFDTTFADNPKYAIYMYKGSDEPELDGSDGRCKYNQVYENTLISPEKTIRVMDADDNSFIENNVRGQYSSFIDSTGNLVTNGTYNYHYEGRYVTDTEIEVVADEDHLTGNETSKYGFIVKNSYFSSGSEPELPTCGNTR